MYLFLYLKIVFYCNLVIVLCIWLVGLWFMFLIFDMIFLYRLYFFILLILVYNEYNNFLELFD